VAPIPEDLFPTHDARGKYDEKPEREEAEGELRSEATAALPKRTPPTERPNAMPAQMAPPMTMSLDGWSTLGERNCKTMSARARYPSNEAMEPRTSDAP
jgi:hypothetical protein